MWTKNAPDLACQQQDAPRGIVLLLCFLNINFIVIIVISPEGPRLSRLEKGSPPPEKVRGRGFSSLRRERETATGPSRHSPFLLAVAVGTSRKRAKTSFPLSLSRSRLHPFVSIKIRVGSGFEM